MQNYSRENDLSWSPSNLIGGFLILLGVVVLIWVVISIYQLFTNASSFFVMDAIIPQEIALSDVPNGNFLIPRELLIFGVPIWALSVSTSIGITMLKGGLSLIEKSRK